MVSVCFYFQVHQPHRLRNYSVFDIGKSQDYFDTEKNASIMRKVARKCYLPTNRLLLKLLERHPEFRCSFSISGVALEQLQDYAPEVLETFKRLAATGRVELLAETYYHSLSFLRDKEEFREQVEQHVSRIQELFGQTPTVFRNTELIYNNELANFIERMGFSGILAEGWDHILGWRSPNFVYRSKTTSNLRLLLKNYRLSDDNSVMRSITSIAFRFSNRGWSEWPLTVEKFASWVNNVNGAGHTINLFMDYETFGEHQWEETGIFEFLEALPAEVLKHPDNDFKTVSEVVASYDPMDEIDVHNYLSWADLERDLSAWIGNNMQRTAIEELYRFGTAVKRTGNPQLLDTWRRLTTSDHLYYMCTKWFSDGDVHKYFNPYDSPYEGYIAFMNILHDLAIRVRVELHRSGKVQPVEGKHLRVLTERPSSALPHAH